MKIFNTLTKKNEEFKTNEKNKVKMYVCGPTVYNNIHIGNARPLVFFDTVHRYLEHIGYDVKYVQNFTDIDDKIINRANDENIDYKEIAEKFINEYYKDTKALNLKEDETIHPRATEYLDDMIKFIEDLIEKKQAYIAANRDVYFDVEKFKGYGKLSGKNLEDLKIGARIAENKFKKNPYDFVLWKSSKKNEPFWSASFGNGRPGWHLECSVMSLKLLGKNFDLHCGGIDLIFPHHENEIAQSESHNEEKFVNYWMHNGHVNFKGEKMSKSEGNFFLLKDILDEYEGDVVRMFLLSTHYRKPLEFSKNGLNSVKISLDRIRIHAASIDSIIQGYKQKETSDIEKIQQAKRSQILFNWTLKKLKTSFYSAMNNDFNLSKVFGILIPCLSELHTHIRTINILKFYDNLPECIAIKEFIDLSFEEILGIKINGFPIYTTKYEINIPKFLSDLKKEVEKILQKKEIDNSEIEFLIQKRYVFKKQKDWDFADKIRNSLSNINIEIRDEKDDNGKDIVKWRRN